MRLRAAISGVMAVFFAAAASVAMAGQAGGDDPMLKGLQDRGLKTLSDLYIKLKPAAPPPAPASKVAALPPGASKFDQAKAAQAQAIATRNVADRDELFKSAQGLYEQAIKDAEAKTNEISQEKILEKAEAHLATLKMHEALGNMIFIQWLKNDLDFLEVTDRRYTEGLKDVVDRLSTANGQYKACIEDGNSWVRDLGRMNAKDKAPLVNKGIERQVNTVLREVRYALAWVTYYRGWVLAKDYKAPKGEPSRKDILDDAILKFEEFTKMPDAAAPKWYATMMIGLVYREEAQDDKGYDKALQQLTLADTTNAPVGVRVRISFERALTYLRKGDKAKARQVVDDALKFWGNEVNEKKQPILTSELYGIALPLVKAESLILESDKALSDEGSRIFSEFSKRENPWPILVGFILEKIKGAPTVGPGTEPALLWMYAGRTFTEAEKAKDNKAAAAELYKKAAAYYKAYADKVGPADKDYDNAMKMAAHCFIQAGQKDQAAPILEKLANTASKTDMAADAGRIVVSITGEIYQAVPSEPNRAAYEQKLKWFIAKWPAVDPELQFYLGNVLWVGKKYEEAGLVFARVTVASEHYSDARYWMAMSSYEQFRQKVLTSADKKTIQPAARQMAKNLLAYSDYADGLLKKGGQADERVKLLNDQALGTTMAAAETYLLPEVMLPQEALGVIGILKQRFASQLTGDALGHVLLMEIISYQIVGQLDKAAAVLDDYLRVAKPDEVGPVLDGLFKAMIANVKDLISRKVPDQAAVKVEQAKAMGDRLRDWISRNAAIKAEDKAKQIEAMRYDVAELILAVGKYSEALDLYKDIGGPSPEDANTTGGWLKEACIYGQARAHEGLAEADPANGKSHYEKAAAQWSVLVDIAGRDRSLDRQAVWERIYHSYYCRYKLGLAEDVAKGLTTRKVLADPEPLGGYKDQALQAKFAELLENARIQAGMEPQAAPPPPAPAATPSATPSAAPPAAAALTAS